MSPIARLKGVVAERGPDWLIVDVNGVGYLVYGPAGTVAAARTGAEIALHTHLAVREDGMTLYGFASADELSYAVASGNAAALSRAPGVGQKLASRIVLELRGKLAPEAPVALPGDAPEVVAALMGLGYSQAEALEAVAKSEPPADAPVEDRVRLALGYFARARAGGE